MLEIKSEEENSVKQNLNPNFLTYRESPDVIKSDSEDEKKVLEYFESDNLNMILKSNNIYEVCTVVVKLCGIKSVYF